MPLPREKDQLFRFIDACHALDLGRARSASPGLSAEEALMAFEALVAGRWSLVQSFESDGRRFLLAVRNQPLQIESARVSPLEGHAMLLRAQGLSYKVIGYELGLAASAAFVMVKRGMTKLGVAREADLPLLFRAQLEAELAHPREGPPG